MAYMGHQHHLTKFENEPSPPKKDVLRIYSTKFCPFSQRVKLVLAAKDIEHETVNIHLAKKPVWLFNKNPKGKVPLLEINGEVLAESDILAEFVDAAYEGKRKVIESDPVLRAKGKMLLGELEAVIGSYYRTQMMKEEKAKKSAAEKMAAGLAPLDNFLRETGHNFISGSQAGLNDYMFWPFLQVIALTFMDYLKQYKDLHAYFHRMGEDDAVIKCRHPAELQKEFIADFSIGKMEYDIGPVWPSIQ